MQQAGEYIRLDAGRNIEARSGRRVRIDAAENARVTVQNGQSVFTVQNGEVHIQAARELRIKGQGGGDITFAQGGGGFTIAPDGTVTLFGNTVTLKGNSVTFNGPVSYDIGSAQIPGIPEALAPLAVGGIAALESVSASLSEPELRDVEIHIADVYDNKIASHFELLKGLAWRIVSDLGDERTGVIESEIILVEGLRAKDTFSFEIEYLHLVPKK